MMGTSGVLHCAGGAEAAFGIEFGLSSPRADEGRAGGPYRRELQRVADDRDIQPAGPWHGAG